MHCVTVLAVFCARASSSNGFRSKVLLAAQAIAEKFIVRKGPKILQRMRRRRKRRRRRRRR
jgi:hypothetical protein